jgi:hypothetical protein
MACLRDREGGDRCTFGGGRVVARPTVDARGTRERRGSPLVGFGRPSESPDWFAGGAAVSLFAVCRLVVVRPVPRTRDASSGSMMMIDSEWLVPSREDGTGGGCGRNSYTNLGCGMPAAVVSFRLDPAASCLCSSSFRLVVCDIFVSI